VIENPIKYQELFKVFSLLLADRIIDEKQINNFADEILSKETNSEYEFIELSTTKNLNDLISLLNKFSTNCNTKIAYRAVLGIIYNLNINIETSSRCISRLSYLNGLSEKEKDFINGIDDFIDLAINKIYGDINRLNSEYLDFLKIYNEFNFDSAENWNAINSKIEHNLIEKIQHVIDKHKLKSKKWW